jgi:uncharacterized membrane protein
MDTNRGQSSTAGQGLGIAGLILGILAILIAFIPCIGVLAVVPGGVALILSIIGMTQANRGDGSKGLVVAALVLSILSIVVAIAWGIFFAGSATIFNKISKEIKTEIEQELGEDFDEAFDDFGNELEKTLEDLESDSIITENDWGKEISDEEFERLMNAYENVIQDFSQITKSAAEKGNLSAIREAAKTSMKAAAIATKMAKVKLTEAQREKFEELQKRYRTTNQKLEEIQEEQEQQ